MECGDIIYRSTLPKSSGLTLTAPGAVLALGALSYLWATPGVAPGFFDMFVLAFVERLFRPTYKKEGDLVLKKVTEYGAVEIWMNERVRRACANSCANFVYGFLETSAKKASEYWLIWKFEGDATLADLVQSREFPYNVETLILGSRTFKIIDLGAATDLRVGINYIPKEFLLDPRSHRDEEAIIDNIDLANYLITLSHPREITKPHHKSFSPLEFECSTCNRKFSSFQALGGHRTSHKKQKLEGNNELKAQTKTLSLLRNYKHKIHECSICGQKFSQGQALGGHMRKHKVAINEGFSSSSSSINQVVAKIPVLKRSNSSRRVLCLDLNLTPLQNDLKLLFGNMAPKIDSFV
ncbi:hypothetical protein RIF29_20218 [Crotalaria pallida]|uniref:C2H2-type domain-containing protein n=1 Tax=Crotalaria pallida TaxID=3830 RepID=A0AAN9F0Q9_CROPI